MSLDIAYLTQNFHVRLFDHIALQEQCQVYCNDNDLTTFGKLKPKEN